MAPVTVVDEALLDATPLLDELDVALDELLVEDALLELPPVPTVIE